MCQHSPLEMKRSVYIETSIPSYLTARPSRDVRAVAWQQITSEWWDTARQNYDLFTSALVIKEASAGNQAAAERRLLVLGDIPKIDVNDQAEKLAELLIIDGGVPTSARIDAFHVAAAAVHKMDYLLTWNCRHMSNAVKRPVIRSICLNASYLCPEICTPTELLT